MSDKHCEICGADLDPLTGSLEISLTKAERLRRWNMDVPVPVCAICFSELLKEAERKYGAEFAYEEDPPPEFKKKTRERIKKLSVWTSDPFPAGSVRNLGLVSGHVILGTGFLTRLSAALTDMAGKKSEAYNELITVAEKECLAMLKENAFNKGAAAIVGLRVNYTELSGAGNSVMVNMIGTAVVPSNLVVF
jgi:uncharacterized protein YbjQ (UPF0145 family)